MGQFLMQRYADQDLTDLVETTSVPVIDYFADVPQSVRFTGYIRFTYSETYTIVVSVNDGTRTWFNGVLKIDEWHDSPGTNYHFDVDVTAGETAFLQVEYLNSIEYGVALVLYSSPSQAQILIPAVPDPDPANPDCISLGASASASAGGVTVGGNLMVAPALPGQFGDSYGAGASCPPGRPAPACADYPDSGCGPCDLCCTR